MILEHRGRRPRIDPSAWIAPDATVCGDVTVGEDTAVLSGAVLTAEGGPVVVGSNCVVMERAVLRGTPGHPCRVDDHVLIGPGAHLSGCAVETLSFLATGVTVLNGARIGRVGDVRIGAVVHARTRVPPSTTIPIGWVAVGDPAGIHPPADHDRIDAVQRTLGFRDAAFGMGEESREAFMREMTRRYARALSRHRDDRPVDGGPDRREASPWRRLARRLWDAGAGT